MAFLVPLCYITALDNLGEVVSAARGYIYMAGTTTALQSYSNYTLSSANAVPYITANSAGRFPNAYVADGSLLRFLITSADGATTYYDRDNVFAPQSASVTTLMQTYVTQNSGFAIDPTMNGQLIGIDTSLSDVAVTADPVTLQSGFWFSLKKLTLDGNKVTFTPTTGLVDGAASYEMDTYQEGATFVSQAAVGFAITAATSREEFGEIDLAEVTAATYTFVLADKGKLIKFNRATAQVVTVPSNANVPFPIGTRIEALQYGLGEVSFTPFAGVTLNSVSTFRDTVAQWSIVVLTKMAANEWLLSGDLEA